MMIFQKCKVGFFLLTLATGFLSQSCTEGKGSKETSNTSSSASKLAVDAIVVNPQYFESKLLTTANLLPYEEVTLMAPLAGTVLKIAFKEGQLVNRGDLLVTIDDRFMKAQIKGLKAQLDAGKTELFRLRELKKIEGASQEEIDQSEANVLNLEAQIEQLEINVGLANVVAPFDGRVGMRNFSVGTYMTPGQEITQLAQQSKLKVDFNLSSRYVNQIYEGKLVNVISNGDTLEAKIYAINPVASSTSRTIQIRAEIQKNEKNFIPGSFAEIVLPLDVDENALIVPTSVIIPELNSQSLFIYKNGTARRREVTLGTRTEGEIQILSGIVPGDTILTTGLLQIKDGTPVTIGNIETE